jgi:hypothetical protein
MKSLSQILGQATDYRSAIIEQPANWILVQRGAPDAVAQAIEAYGKLYPATVPQACTLVISRSAWGGLGIRLPDRVPTYSFVNLIGWLNRPPDMPGVASAIGWYTSPATGIRYALYPDPKNSWGDTLIGYNRQNQAVSVYLPDASLCEITRRVAIYREPANQAGLQEQARVTVIFDADPSASNFNFVETHAKDHLWT